MFTRDDLGEWLKRLAKREARQLATAARSGRVRSGGTYDSEHLGIGHGPPAFAVRHTIPETDTCHPALSACWASSTK